MEALRLRWYSLSWGCSRVIFYFRRVYFSLFYLNYSDMEREEQQEDSRVRLKTAANQGWFTAQLRLMRSQGQTQSSLVSRSLASSLTRFQCSLVISNSPFTVLTKVFSQLVEAKGSRPRSRKQSTEPMEKTSDLVVTFPVSRISGAMQLGVPAAFSPCSIFSISAIWFASPKSIILIFQILCPCLIYGVVHSNISSAFFSLNITIIFSGFKSRCTISSPCKNITAFITLPIMNALQNSFKNSRFRTYSYKSSPQIYSVMMYSWVFVWRVSMYLTTWLWFRIFIIQLQLLIALRAFGVSFGRFITFRAFTLPVAFQVHLQTIEYLPLPIVQPVMQFWCKLSRQQIFRCSSHFLCWTSLSNHRIEFLQQSEQCEISMPSPPISWIFSPQRQITLMGFFLLFLLSQQMITSPTWNPQILLFVLPDSILPVNSNSMGAFMQLGSPYWQVQISVWKAEQQLLKSFLCSFIQFEKFLQLSFASGLALTSISCWLQTLAANYSIKAVMLEYFILQVRSLLSTSQQVPQLWISSND